MCTLRDYKYARLIISRSVLLKVRNVLGNRSIQNQNTNFMLINLFFENRAVYGIKWKNIVEPGRSHGNMVHVHCILDT
jgi:hypothetical protein